MPKASHGELEDFVIEEGRERDLPRLDVQLYFDVFQIAAPAKARGGAKKQSEVRE